MNNIIAIRVEQKLVWNENFGRYDADTWNLVYLVEGSPLWKQIPILTQYRGGPQDGLSQLSDGVTINATGKEENEQP